MWQDSKDTWEPQVRHDDVLAMLNAADVCFEDGVQEEKDEESQKRNDTDSRSKTTSTLIVVVHARVSVLIVSFADNASEYNYRK